MNLKKFERYLRVNLLGPGPCLIKKIIYWATASQRLRNTGVDSCTCVVWHLVAYLTNVLFIRFSLHCLSIGIF